MKKEIYIPNIAGSASVMWSGIDMYSILGIVIAVILSVIAFYDKRLSFFAGIAWIWVALDIFISYHIILMFIGVGVGLYMIAQGVWNYVED